MKYLLLIALASLSLWAKAMVYKISDEHNNTLYIGGTIHVLRSSDYPLNPAYFEAYSRSSILYLEADLEQSAEFSRSVIQTLSYTPPKRLQDDLNSSTYKALEIYAKDHKLNLESLNHFKAGMSVINILMNALDELDINTIGVDKYFYIQAKEKHKPIGFLESSQSQIELLASMGKGQENELIASTLSDVKTLKEEMFDIVQNWKNGDEEALEEDLIRELQTEYPKLYQDILVKRNTAWIKKITPMFNTKPIEYILVGTMHLIGKDGLLTYFREHNYSVSTVAY